VGDYVAAGEVASTAHASLPGRAPTWNPGVPSL